MIDHKMELLKALREHGQTIQKMAVGGQAENIGFGGSTPQASLAGPSQQGVSSTGGQGGLLGLNSTFQAQGANLTPGTNASQLQGAYSVANQAQSNQQNLLNALQGQNGIQNQSQNYAALGNVANSQGPNPAQAMLNQATGQNVANQAALTASQRGASSNVGLLARQAAQTGAQTQQNAVGQAAALQSQQQLNALNAQAGIAQNQVANQAAATGAYTGAGQGEQSILQNANTALNNNITGIQSNINSTNAQTAAANQASQNGLLGGVLQGAAIGAIALAKDGGEVSKEGGKAKVVTPIQPKKFAAGGSTGPFNVFSPTVPVGPAAPGASTAPAAGGPQSAAGQFLSGGGAQPASPFATSSNPFQNAGTYGGIALANALSPGAPPMQTQDQADEDYMEANTQLGYAGTDNPEITTAGEGAAGIETAAKGALIGALKKGGKVPGKPKVGGAVNTEKNDTVPALLSAGEIVLPRSVTQSADPVSEAAKFVHALLQKKAKMACGGQVQKYSGESGDPSDSVVSDGKTQFEKDFPNFNQKVSDWFSPQASVQQAQAGQMPAAQPQAPASPSQAPSDQPTNMSIGPATPPNAMQNAYNNSNADLYQGLNTTITGHQNEADAIGKFEDQKAGIFDRNQKTLQYMAAQAQQNAFDNKFETSAMIDDMKKSHIDPNAYMNNMGATQKTATAIGLLLGGMGGGILKTGANPAADFLNKQIERDVSAQQANIENKKTIFNAIQAKYGNQVAATKMTQAFYTAKMENEINEAAARSGSPIAQARAQQLIGPLQTQLQQLHFEVGMRQAAMSAMQNGGDAAAAIPYLVPKDQQPKAVEAYGKIKELNALEADMNQSAQDLHGKFMNGVLSPNDSASAREAYSGAIQKLSEGRYNKDAADKIVSSMLPETTDVGNQTYSNKAHRRGNFFEAFRKEPKAVLDMHFVPSPQPAAPINKR